MHFILFLFLLFVCLFFTVEVVDVVLNAQKAFVLSILTGSNIFPFENLFYLLHIFNLTCY